MIETLRMDAVPRKERQPPTLRRALGRWDLTAIGVNQVIGGAIFLMPSQVAAQVGGWSWIAFVLTGLASLLVALCFAEVSSRFESTGGPYLYTRAAFGPFVAFEVGWMQWFTRVSSHASVINGLALALGFYWPILARGTGRATVIIALTLALTIVNILGIRQSAWVVNILTIGKLLPLAMFILVGAFFVDLHRLGPLAPITLEQATTAALLLIFVYGGFDVVSVPAGEARSPQRQVPFALLATIAIVTLVMTLAQVVAMGTLPNLAASNTPLADAAFLFIGAGGALLIGIGSVVSMTGNIAGQILTGSRMLFALAENRALPDWFGRIHARFRTPSNAVLFSSAVALTLALSGSFVMMAVVSSVSRLVIYTGASAATLVLRGQRYQSRVKNPTFVIPMGPVVPILAVLVSMIILVGATRQQLLGGAAALTGGALLFVLNYWGRRGAGSQPAGD
jgi:amino acid transporter